MVAQSPVAELATHHLDVPDFEDPALSELLMLAVGSYALPFERESLEEGDLRSVAGPDYAATLAAGYCNSRKVTIYGGSNEIQRNIISQMILGL